MLIDEPSRLNNPANLIPGSLRRQLLRPGCVCGRPGDGHDGADGAQLGAEAGGGRLQASPPTRKAALQTFRPRHSGQTAPVL